MSMAGRRICWTRHCRVWIDAGASVIVSHSPVDLVFLRGGLPQDGFQALVIVSVHWLLFLETLPVSPGFQDADVWSSLAPRQTRGSTDSSGYVSA